MCGAGVPAFFELACENPETVVDNWIPFIHRFLDWYQSDFELLLDKMNLIGIPGDILFTVSPLDSDLIAAEKQFRAIGNELAQLCDMSEAVIHLDDCQSVFDRAKAVLLSGKRGSSRLCRNLRESVDLLDWNAYADGYAELEKAFEKYALQSSREDMLKQLEPVAPDWANAIRHRTGIHAECTLPDSMEDTWKWKQLQGIIEEITSMPFRDLQAKSLMLSARYRETTALYAEKCAWYHLLRRTEANVALFILQVEVLSYTQNLFAERGIIDWFQWILRWNLATLAHVKPARAVRTLRACSEKEAKSEMDNWQGFRVSALLTNTPQVE